MSHEEGVETMYGSPESSGQEIVRTAWRHADADGNDRRDRIIWAAGFLDGDGSFGVYVQNKGRTWGGTYTLIVQGVQVAPEPLRKLHALWGGSLHHRDGQGQRRDYYQWVASGQTAIQVLRDIGPYLVGKREEYEVVLRFWEVREQAWNREMTPDEQVFFEECRQSLMALKRRTYH